MRDRRPTKARQGGGGVNFAYIGGELPQRCRAEKTPDFLLIWDLTREFFFHWRRLQNESQ